ncbi:hypothetical protein Q1695_012323 [Nippostrongylus brasiliensis]|nr:hypothetical protein Q1695_012323 [Nippostrongylus brasiliensis]
MTPEVCGPAKTKNVLITTAMFGAASYSLVFTSHATFAEVHSSLGISSKLLLIAWAIQALVSLAFLIYWQFSGQLQSFHKRVTECQSGKGLSGGRKLILRNVSFFFAIIFVEVSLISMYHISCYTGTAQPEFISRRQVQMFYFPELYIINGFITLYTYVAWNITMFIYIMYTDAAYLETKHFNESLEELDGSASGVEDTLLIQMELYGRICDVIRELDRIFKLYAFIMLAIIIPSVTLTLMMLNHRIHSFKDLMICSPSIALCAYSFFAITIAPARLHDEVNRSRACLIRNRSIWFPYRREVFIISQTLLSHMEECDMGISIWGFAILSRPLILGVKF